MYIANDLKNVVNKPYIDGVRDSFIENFSNVLSNYFADKHMFTMNDFSYIFYDEYILKTNCHDKIFSTLYFEINQPSNYKLNTKPKKKKSTKIQIPDLYITLSSIKNGLYNTFISYFDSNNIVWQDKYGVCLRSIVLDEKDNNHEYFFRVIPCLTYYNENNVKGLMYYSNGDIEIEYPDIAIKNFNKKNKQTKGLFKQTILIIKNILLKDDKIEQLPSEIVETLLYNVPNELFVSDSKSDILNIINFIRNNPLKEFRTIDEQDYAFSSLYRSMSPYYCKHIMKIIENYLSRK